MTKFIVLSVLLLLGTVSASVIDSEIKTQVVIKVCGPNQIETPSGCWNSCSDPRFSKCGDIFPALYNPSFCAYTVESQYVSYTFECQACKNNANVVAVRSGACSCDFLKCGLNQVCEDAQCVDRHPVDPLPCKKLCLEGYVCKNGQCVQACGANQYQTPSGCWNSCSDPRFSLCPDFFPALYKPSFCAFTKEGKYVNHTYECQACKNTEIVAVRNEPCSCDFLKCGLNEVCQNGQCVEQTPIDFIQCRMACSPGFVCRNGRCMQNIDITCATIRCAPGYKCLNGKCVLIDLCATIKCMAGYVCKNGKCVKDIISIDPCLNIECLPGLECKLGKCIKKLDSCSFIKCAAGFICQDGKCVEVDKCTNIKCKTGFFCNQGECIDKCAVIRCMSGYKCENGQCIPQVGLCGGSICNSEQICQNNKCVAIVSPCALVFCQFGTTCQNGKCVKISQAFLTGEYTTNINQDKDLRVKFDESRVSIINGCNAHGASYKAYSNSSIEFGVFFGTKMACEFDQDSLYVQALSSSISWTKVENTIVFKNKDGKITITLTVYSAGPVSFAGEYSTNIPDISNLILNFTQTRVSLLNGCNIHSGEYKALDDGSFSLRAFMSTQRYCIVDYDHLYLQALTNATNFVKDAETNEVTLLNSAGETTIILTFINKCLTVKCSSGTHCENGVCVPDMIVDPPPIDNCAAVSCLFGSACVDGKCVVSYQLPPQTQEDLCADIYCIATTTCIDGKCVPLPENLANAV